MLYGSLTMVGGYLYWMEQTGVIVTTKQMDLVTVEKYDGVINYKYKKNEE